MCLNYKNNEDIHFSIFLVLPYYSKLSSLALFPSTDKHSVYFLNKPTVHRVSSRFILIVKTCTSQHKDIRVNSLSHCGFFFFFWLVHFQVTIHNEQGVFNLNISTHGHMVYQTFETNQQYSGVVHFKGASR